MTAAVLAGFSFAGDVQDVISLELQFTVSDPVFNGIQFDLMFASDEFPEFSDTPFVDIAGFFVNGTNYGLFNGRVDQPLSIIDRNLAADGFRDNAQSAIPIEYDGVSVKLSIAAPVQQGVNSLKIAIGGLGIDTALFVGNAASFSVAKVGGGHTVADSIGAEGTDTLIGVERVHFENKKIALALGNGEAAGNTVRIIGAAFDAPAIQQHPEWVGIGLQFFDGNQSMLEVCGLVVQILGLTNTAFVETVYQYVVGSAPDTVTRRKRAG